MKYLALGLYCFATCALAQDAPLFIQAETIFKTMTHSSYQYKRFIDEEKRIYKTTCSGYISFLVGKVSPQALQVLPYDLPHKRPRAKNFQAFFENLAPQTNYHGWEKVEFFSKVQKGDIIAWSYDPESGRRDTGHVVMVYDNPVQQRDGCYLTRVMDSSKGTHGKDTRQNGASGIGIGTMWFCTDTQDKPIGLYWSDRSAYMKRYPISIGRLLPHP